MKKKNEYNKYICEFCGTHDVYVVDFDDMFYCSYCYEGALRRKDLMEMALEWESDSTPQGVKNED